MYKLKYILLAVSVLSVQLIFAKTFYFSNSGNDINDGLSTASPKKTLHAAIELALPGNTLLFKRGDSWYNPFNTFDLRNKKGQASKYIIIDAYGSGDKPVISTLLPLEEGWRNVAGTTRWQFDVVGFSSAYRLYENGKSKYKVNTSDPAANDNNVDQPYKWYIKPVVEHQSGIVYINTGDATKSPGFVEIHPEGAAPVFFLENSGFIKIRNIDIRGGSNGNVVYIDAPSDHIIIEECIVRQSNGSGIQVENNGKKDITSYVSNMTVRNCLIDKVWSAQENDPNIFLSGDGVFFRHAVDRGLIEGNTIINWGHSGISITSYFEGMHGVHNIIVQMNDVSAGESAYLHGLDMNGFKDMTTHNIVRRNYFHDYTTTSHILGSFNQIYSNIFAGVRGTKMPKHHFQPFAADWVPWQYQGKGAWIEAHDNFLVNNTFADMEHFAVAVGDDPNNPTVTTNNVIANNIFYSFGESKYGTIAINVNDKLRGTVFIENNDTWNKNMTQPAIRFKNISKSLNFSSEMLDRTYPEYCTDNVEEDPAFASPEKRDFHLTKRTPKEVKAGATPKYLKIFGKDFTDYYGKPWNPVQPSMGAIQYGTGD